ncbi:CoA transferase [Xanthobacter autotrophicus]|uniref:CaiB/BaiF CoA-transferase family protein n=1 Tax=Xanthobacter autotrophicus TaxID=280 RepID=UPI00372C06F1
MPNEDTGGAQLDLPLRGVRVAELVSGPMRLAGRFLADLGADVVHVPQPPRHAPGAGERMFAGVSLDAIALNRGKTVQLFDPTIPAERDALLRLIETVDILIEDVSGPATASGWLDIPALQESNKSLVILSISDFGRTGAFAGWAGTDPVFHALSGQLARSGIPGREPLLPPGALALRCAAAQAAVSTMLAFHERLQSGHGDWLDFSNLDGVVQTLDPGFGVAGSAAAGSMAADTSRGRPDVRFRYPIIACADGFVRVCLLSARQWRGMFSWMGSPSAFADPSFDQIQVRFGSPDLIPAIARFFADKSRAELEREGQTFGVPIAMVRSPQEAVETEQNAARHLFETLSLAEDLDVRLSRTCLTIDGTRAGAAARQLQDGSVTQELFNGLKEGLASKDEARSGEARSGRPLAGIRVLDLGVIVVGAETGRLFADAGADVVKIENAAFPDGLRQTRDGGPISQSFASGHRNKRGLSLDLRSSAGKALFLDLVRNSDVLLSNFKPGTLEGLGFDRQTLLEANPRLVMVDSSAFGPSGPASGSLGYGPLVRSAAGITAQWAYPGEAGSFSDAFTIYPDHVAARLGALTALALLVRRRRTGQGGSGSIAQAEVILDHMGADIAAAELVAAGQAVDGLEPDAPWGVYPCAGDDEWCAVTVRGDGDWTALSALIGLAGDLNLNHREGRVKHRAEIEHALKAWLAHLSPIEAMERLQNAGVPAGAMLRVIEMPEFAYFRERDFYRKVRHPALSEPIVMEARPVRSARLADPELRPAPLMGEHTFEVLQEWLGLSSRQIEDLIDAEVVAVRQARRAA